MKIDPKMDEEFACGPGPTNAAACSASSIQSYGSNFGDPTLQNSAESLKVKIRQRKPADAIYSSGRRSARLLRLIGDSRGLQPSMQTILTGANIIFGIWEKSNNSVSSSKQDIFRRLNQLANYMAGLVIRTKVSPVTFLAALYYVAVLGCTYPGETGGSGCATRIFSVALMVSARYLELPLFRSESLAKSDAASKTVPEYHEFAYWSVACGGVFRPEELDKMEHELIVRLKYDLYISSADLEAFVHKYILESSWVPNNRDRLWLKEIMSLPMIQEEEEPLVPEIDFVHF